MIETADYASYPDVLDIVFEHRNKAYGAYQLRRAYQQRLGYALGMGILLIFAASLVLHYTKWPVTPKKGNIMCMCIPPDIDIEFQMPPPVILTSPPPQRKPTVQYTPPIVVKDSDVPPEYFIVVRPPKNQVGNNDSEASTDTSALQPIADYTQFPKVAVLDSIQTFELSSVEKMPSFIGGENALYMFLKENITYPAERCIQGTAVIAFTIEKNGAVAAASILKDPGGGCGKEALRVVNMMPRWTPGEVNGVPVRVRFVLPVRFKLE